MTILAVILGGLAAYGHFTLVGHLVAPGLTVWVAWFAFVALVFLVQIVKTKQRDVIAPGLIAVGGFLASHLIWINSISPLMAHAAKNLAIAISLGICLVYWPKWQIASAFFTYFSLVFIAALADFGLMFPANRPMQFLAWSYPDVAAVMNYAAFIVLSLPGRIEDEALDMGESDRDLLSGGVFAPQANRAGTSQG